MSEPLRRSYKNPIDAAEKLCYEVKMAHDGFRNNLGYDEETLEAMFTAASVCAKVSVAKGQIEDYRAKYAKRAAENPEFAQFIELQIQLIDDLAKIVSDTLN